MIQAIVFDLDDTLVHSERIYDSVLRRLGPPVDSAAYQQARRLVKNTLGDGHPSARNRLLYFKRALESRGRLSSATLLELMDRYEELLFQEVRSEWRSLGRDELFEGLSKKAELYILTNENVRTQMIKLKAIDPESKWFSGIVCSEEVGVEKPDPAIFNVLSTRYLIGKSPDSILFVGDDPTKDLEPARVRGWKTLQTHEFVHKDSPLKHDAISKLQEVSLKVNL